MYNRRNFFDELNLDTREHHDLNPWLCRHKRLFLAILIVLAVLFGRSWLDAYFYSQEPVEVIKVPYAGIGSDAMQSEEWGWRE